MPDPFTPQRLKVALAALVALVLAILIFHAGVAVGSRRAFHDRPGGFAPFGHMPILPHGFIPHGHGAVGVVESVATSSFALQTREGESETVLFASTTEIRSAGTATSTTLAAGETVLVLGRPVLGGAITADAVRILSR